MSEHKQDIFDEETGSFNMDKVKEATTHETPFFISHLYEFLTDGKMKGFDK